jgi:hypothetical protein
LLRNVLERQEVSSRPPIILYYFVIYIDTSPNLSSITCSSTSVISLSLLVDLFFPSFLYSCNIKSVFLYLLVVADITLLDDLFFFSLLYTFVSGLFVILLMILFLVVIFLDTVVFAALSDVKCFHIGLLFSCASSYTRFIL